jgi:hypothetical protein
VEDVQRILPPDKGKLDKGKSDARIARQLSGLELTERMSSAKLKSLEQNVSGMKSRWALVALADASVFLGPPAADVLSQAPPDANEQQRMIDLIVEYLARTLPSHPTFTQREPSLALKTYRAGDARGRGPGIIHPGDKWAAQRWSSRIATGRK